MCGAEREDAHRPDFADERDLTDDERDQLAEFTTARRGHDDRVVYPVDEIQPPERDDDAD
ncbi:MAG: hypothetical protein HY331_03145 [Chloroflexi bacterium]|nr:hypothetical protein [Chloroflexota bacterium]